MPHTEDMSESTEIVIYTRPGCPFCVALRAELRAAGLAYQELDIWQDRTAAAAVRAVADGNETVPTVRVNGQWFVNPSIAQVRDALRPVA